MFRLLFYENVFKISFFKEEVSPLLWEKKVDVTGRCWLSSRRSTIVVEIGQQPERAMRHVRNLVRSRYHRTRSILVLLGGGLLTITLLLVRNLYWWLHFWLYFVLANN